MRMALITQAGAFTALALLAGCTRPPGEGASSSTAPTRKAGLWEQVLTRDGKPGRLGKLKICLDAASEVKFSAFGRHFDKGDCRRTVTREAGGVYRFTAACELDNGAVVKTMGTATGDFSSSYRVHTQVDISGAPFEPMNGIHAIELTGRYLGPCPGNMRPGDVSLGSGVQVNIERLPKIAAAIGGG